MELPSNRFFDYGKVKNWNGDYVISNKRPVPYQVSLPFNQRFSLFLGKDVFGQLAYSPCYSQEKIKKHDITWQLLHLNEPDEPFIVDEDLFITMRASRTTPLTVDDMRLLSKLFQEESYDVDHGTNPYSLIYPKSFPHDFFNRWDFFMNVTTKGTINNSEELNILAALRLEKQSIGIACTGIYHLNDYSHLKGWGPPDEDTFMVCANSNYDGSLYEKKFPREFNEVISDNIPTTWQQSLDYFLQYFDIRANNVTNWILGEEELIKPSYDRWRKYVKDFLVSGMSKN